MTQPKLFRFREDNSVEIVTLVGHQYGTGQPIVRDIRGNEHVALKNWYEPEREFFEKFMTHVLNTLEAIDEEQKALATKKRKFLVKARQVDAYLKGDLHAPVELLNS